MKVSKLVSLNKSTLNHAELKQLVTRLIEEYESSGLTTTDDDFKRVFDQLKEKNTHFQKAMEQVKASEYTAQLKIADEARDADLRALMTGVKAYQFSKRPTEEKAYKSLQLLLKQYKDTPYASYEEETALLTALLAKLQSDEYQDDIAILGIEHFITNLVATHVEFNRLFSMRIKENIAKKHYDVVEQHADLLSYYQNLCEYIRSMTWFNTSEFYRELFEIVNGGRKYIADLQARRTGRSKEKRNPDESKKEHDNLTPA